MVPLVHEHFGLPFERIGCGLIGVNLTGTDLPFTRLSPNSLGAAEIPIEAALSRFVAGVNRPSIRIS